MPKLAHAAGSMFSRVEISSILAMLVNESCSSNGNYCRLSAGRVEMVSKISDPLGAYQSPRYDPHGFRQSERNFDCRGRHGLFFSFTLSALVCLVS